MTSLAATRAWYAAEAVRHLDTEGRQIVKAATPAEHDAHVAAKGRPYTQDPRPLRADTVNGRTRAAETAPEHT